MTARGLTQLQTCGTMRPLGEVVDDPVGELRFHRQIERLHRLGPRAVGELLAEIAEQRGCRTYIEMRLRKYAVIPPETLRELDGDEFPRPPIYQVKP